MIYNPPELAQQRTVESKHSDNVTKHQDRGGQSSILRDSKGAIKVAVKMEHIMPVFIQQLKMLLGISSSEWVYYCMCAWLYMWGETQSFNQYSVIANVLFFFIRYSLKEWTK